jgi:hypothetical protein
MRTSYPDATAEELYVLVHSDRMFRMPSLHLRPRTPPVAGASISAS